MKFMACTGIALLVAISASADIAYDSASDSAYSSGWSGGSNGGYGFGSWSLSNSSGGSYIGGTALGNPTFGIYSSGSGSFSLAERTFNSGLAAGQTFSVDLAHTSTINGEIGLNLLSGSTSVVTLKFVGGSSNWKLNDGGSDFDIGQTYAANTPLTFSFTYNGGSSYSFSFGSASGNNYTANADISGINGVRFYNNNQGSGENMGFNNLQIIPEPAVAGLISIAGISMLFARRLFKM